MGIIEIIMHMEAKLTLPKLLSVKNRGRPTSAPAPKQMICRLVRFRKTFVFTRERSLGTEIYADIEFSSLR